jgi:RNA-binding protein 23/39
VKILKENQEENKCFDWLNFYTNTFSSNFNNLMTDLDELEALIEAPFKQVCYNLKSNHEKEEKSSEKKRNQTPEKNQKYKNYSKSPERTRSPEREKYYSRSHRREHHHHHERRDERRERDDRTDNRRYRRNSRERNDKYRDDRSEHRRKRSRSPQERGLNFKYEDNKRKREDDEFEYEPADYTLTDEQREKRTIFVYNLSVETSEKQIALFFSKVGRIRDVKLIRDRFTNRSKGFGFVEFADASSIAEALRLTGKKLESSTVMVKSSDADKNLTHNKDPSAVIPIPKTPRRITQLFVSGIPNCITEEDLKNLFDTMGKVVYVNIERGTGETRTGWIKYKTPEDAKKGLIKLNNLHFGGGFKMNVSLARAPDEKDEESEKETLQKKALKLLEKMQQDKIESNCIMLTNMFDPATEETQNFEVEIEQDVRAECEPFGKVLHVFVDKKTKGNVYVKLESVDVALKAKNLLHGRYFDGKMIIVSFIPEKIYDNKFSK